MEAENGNDPAAPECATVSIRVSQFIVVCCLAGLFLIFACIAAIPAAPARIGLTVAQGLPGEWSERLSHHVVHSGVAIPDDLVVDFLLDSENTEVREYVSKRLMDDQRLRTAVVERARTCEGYSARNSVWTNRRHFKEDELVAVCNSILTEATAGESLSVHQTHVLVTLLENINCDEAKKAMRDRALATLKRSLLHRLAAEIPERLGLLGFRGGSSGRLIELLDPDSLFWEAGVGDIIVDAMRNPMLSRNSRRDLQLLCFRYGDWSAVHKALELHVDEFIVREVLRVTPRARLANAIRHCSKEARQGVFKAAQSHIDSQHPLSPSAQDIDWLTSRLKGP